MERIIIDIERPLNEFEGRLPYYPEGYQAHLQDILSYVWYAIQHPGMTGSALMNLACRLKEDNHPFAQAITTLGLLLQAHMKQLGMYQPEFGLNRYHYLRLHGDYAMIIHRV